MARAAAKQSRTERQLAAARSHFRELETEAATFTEIGQPVPVALRLHLERARVDLRLAELADSYGHRAGTPETYAKIDAVDPSRRQAPLGRMYEAGEISDDQWRASVEIGAVAEWIESTVAARGASLEARVDCSGSAHDLLLERLGWIRLQKTYSEWRTRLPLPRRMYLDMILSGQPLVATARSYNQPWRKARKRMLSMLDLWHELKDRVQATVDADDANAIYAKLGCGHLLPPRPKVARLDEDEAA